jgi:hypothetical protein
VILLPPTPEPWTDRHWFQGTFRGKDRFGNDRSEGPFQVALDINNLYGGRVKGYVLGDGLVAARLLFPQGSLELTSDQHDEVETLVRGVCIRTRYPDPGRSRTGPARLVLEFLVDEVTIRQPSSVDSEQLEVTFMLVGPADLWIRPSGLSMSHRIRQPCVWTN